MADSGTGKMTLLMYHLMRVQEEVRRHPGRGAASACVLDQQRTHQVQGVGHSRPEEVWGPVRQLLQSQCAIRMLDVTSGVTRMYLTGTVVCCVSENIPMALCGNKVDINTGK